MAPVFAHGQLRLYLLSLLEGGPKHGYELITALSDRFGGHVPAQPRHRVPPPGSARGGGAGAAGRRGAQEHVRAHGGRATPSSTRAGPSLSHLEEGIAESVRERAAQVREDVRGRCAGLRADLAAAAQRRARRRCRTPRPRRRRPARVARAVDGRRGDDAAGSATSSGRTCAGPTPAGGSSSSPSTRCGPCSTRR